MQQNNINPFNKRPHSPQYKKLLEARKKLPVFGQMDEFLKMVRTLLASYVVRGGQAVSGTHPRS